MGTSTPITTSVMEAEAPSLWEKPEPAQKPPNGPPEFLRVPSRTGTITPKTGEKGTNWPRDLGGLLATTPDLRLRGKC